MKYNQWRSHINWLMLHYKQILYRMLSYTQIKYVTGSPDWCGSVGWASFWEMKGCRFDSQSGHMLGCRFGPQMGHVQEQLINVSHVDVSLPLFLLPSPLTKNNYINIFLENTTGKADITPQCLNYEKVCHYFLNYPSKMHNSSLLVTNNWFFFK